MTSTASVPNRVRYVHEGPSATEILGYDLEPVIHQGLTQKTINSLKSIESAGELLNIFPEFYTSPIAQALADVKKWTISTDTKMPININELLERSLVKGAWDTTERCLTDLVTLANRVPSASNNAYYLEATSDGFIVLDIEKDCDPALAARFLRELPWTYAERSMSGYGYHLVLPLPTNYWQFKNALTNVVLKSSDGTYEILLNHWVTFTREALPHGLKDVPQNGKTMLDKHRMQAWDALYEMLAKDATNRELERVTVSSERPYIPYGQQIVADLLQADQSRTIDDYRGDWSKLHFHLIGRWNKQLDMILPIYAQMPDLSESDEFMHDKPVGLHTYDLGAKAWLIYDALSQYVPHRSKHDTLRRGIPFLLDRVCWAIGASAADVND